MNGFFGMVRTDGLPVNREFLEHITRVLEFRGPDGSSTWAKDDTETPHQSRRPPVGLGQRFRLTGQVRLDARRELVAGAAASGSTGRHGSSGRRTSLVQLECLG